MMDLLASPPDEPHAKPSTQNMGLVDWFRATRETSVDRQTSLLAKVQEVARYGLKHLIWNVINHHRQSSDKDILLLTSRRSGGTMLMEAFARAPGMKFVNQPLKGTHYDPFLPWPRPNDIPLHGVDDQVLEDLFIALFAGRMHVEEEWNPFRDTYHFPSRRVVCKLHNAKHWLDWFRERFDLHVVYLVRHPIPAAMSTMNRGWALLTQLYLADEKVRDSLTPRQMSLVAAESSCTRLERYVLSWLIENLEVLRAEQEGRLTLTVTYESLVSDGGVSLRNICERTQTEVTDSMLSGIQRPSRTVSPGTREILTRNNHDVCTTLRAWEGRTTKDLQRRIQLLLDAFEIDLYTAFSSFPTRASHP